MKARLIRSTLAASIALWAQWAFAQERNSISDAAAAAVATWAQTWVWTESWAVIFTNPDDVDCTPIETDEWWVMILSLPDGCSEWQDDIDFLNSVRKNSANLNTAMKGSLSSLSMLEDWLEVEEEEDPFKDVRETEEKLYENKAMIEDMLRRLEKMESLAKEYE